MANKTVVFNNQYYNGDTSLTLFLLNPSDGSIGNGAGDAVTAGSNGSFSTIVTENITGWWKVVIFKSGNPILEDGWVYFPSDTAGTYVVDNPKTTSEQVVEELNQTDYDGVNFDDAIKIIMSMAQGRIVEVSPGVFDFYARDNSTILYRLTKSGNERTRS